MTSVDFHFCLKGDYSWKTLFYIIVCGQILVSSVTTAQFYLIQHESSSEYTVTKSLPVSTITSCVLECSASSNICSKTEIEAKEEDQKVCHLLRKKKQTESESKELSNKNSSGITRNRIVDDKSIISSFFVRPISYDYPFERKESVFIKGWVLQKRNVCYDNKNQLKTARFNATQSGNITQVKLVHVDGFVQGLKDSLKVHWGSAKPSSDCTTDQCFGTLIVNSNNKMVFPANNMPMTSYHNFNLDGFFDPNSTYITMSRGKVGPYLTEKDEEFLVLLSSTFKHNIDYYAGKHCADVYFHYDPVTPVRPISNSCPLKREESLYIKGWVLQKGNVCYDNENQLKTARFNATQAGNVTQVKLVHVQGFVQGLKDSLKVYWGDAKASADCAKHQCFGTIIVNSNNKMVFPHNIPMTEYFNFNLKGFTDPKSTYITMSRGTLDPYMVKKDEEFLVIIGAKFKKDFTYFAGKHCVDVYFYFD